METGSRKLEALLGLIVMAVLAIFVWLSFEIGGGVPKNASRYSLVFDSALRQPASRAPRIREHTDEILSDVLGLGAHEIGQLHDERVVASATLS